MLEIESMVARVVLLSALVLSYEPQYRSLMPIGSQSLDGSYKKD